MHYFLHLHFSFSLPILYTPGKFSISRSGPSRPFQQLAFLRVSFLPAQVKGQVIPRLLAAVTDTKLYKILRSLTTKVIDAKDDIVLHKTRKTSVV